MKQRLGIAAAIFEKPDLILLDEPTNALDADGTELAAKIIQAEKERGALIILACHEREFLESAADEILKIEHGRFVKEDNDVG
jgi:ABC-2 type transport system ATP-binding protein